MTSNWIIPLTWLVARTKFAPSSLRAPSSREMIGTGIWAALQSDVPHVDRSNSCQSERWLMAGMTIGEIAGMLVRRTAWMTAGMTAQMAVGMIVRMTARMTDGMMARMRTGMTNINLVASLTSSLWTHSRTLLLSCFIAGQMVMIAFFLRENFDVLKRKKKQSELEVRVESRSFLCKLRSFIISPWW